MAAMTEAAPSKTLLLGDIFPNFQAETTNGPMDLHEYLGTSWGLLCSHPADYTPVCTTELGTCAKLEETGEFAKRDVKVMCISVDPLESHVGWKADIKAASGYEVNFPMICDPDGSLSAKLGMLHGDKHHATGLPLTVRSVYVIGPDKKLKLSLTYPATTGRNFNEILRAIDSMQTTSSKSLATPADWKQGEKCMVLPMVTNDQAKERFPEYNQIEVPSGRNYLRMTPVPK